MRKGLKISAFIFGSILFLVLGLLVFLNSKWGQNFVRSRAEAYLKNKLKTEVRIGFLGYGFPKYILIKDALLLDQKQDTLIALGELKVDINMLALFSKKVVVQQLLLRSVHSHLYRNLPDSTFNFSYIIAAFGSNKPTDTSQPKSTASSSFSIDLDRAKLEDIHFSMQDATGGMHFAADLNKLDLRLRKMDLSKMLFHIKELSVDGLRCKVAQDTSWLPRHPDDTSKTKLQLVADDVKLHQVGFEYGSTINKILFALNIGNGTLTLNRFGLENSVIDVERLALSNSAMVLKMGKRNAAPSANTNQISTAPSWLINANATSLAGVDFKMDDDNSDRLNAGIDYSHLYFRNGTLQLKRFHYTGDTISGDVQHFTGTEQSGLDVKELKAAFRYDQQGAELRNLYFKTPYTLLQNQIGVHYPSLKALHDRLEVLQLNIALNKSVLGISDLLVFVPELSKQPLVQQHRNEQVQLDANITGHLDNMSIAHLYLAGLNNTQVLVNGRLAGLPSVQKLNYALNIVKFQSGRKDIEGLVPDTVLNAVRLPDQFGATGSISGNMQDVKTELFILSTDGIAYLKGLVKTSTGKNKEQYDILARTTGLNLGRILKQDSVLGIVSATITAKGVGFDVKTMNAVIDGDIARADVKGYGYHNIKLSGSIAHQQAHADFISSDPNAQVQLTGDADFSGKYAGVKADIRIDSIDLRALRLYSTELRTSGVIHLDFPVLNPDYPQGSLMWWKPVVNADGRRYFMDSLSIVSQPVGESQHIVANLDVMNATITGKTPLTKVYPIIQQTFHQYYSLAHADSLHKVAATTIPQSIPGQYGLELQANIIDKPMLHGLLPGLTSFDSIQINAHLAPQQLNLNVTAPDIVYGATSIENGLVTVDGTDTGFTYKVTADKVAQNNLVLWYSNLHGNISHENMTANLSLSDETHKERFAIAASMHATGDSQIFLLQPGLKLDYTDWNVKEPNRIVIAAGGVYVNNFEISNAGQYIRANSQEQKINAPLKIDITNFLLSNITNAISKRDTLLAGGLLGGVITIDQMNPALKVTGDLEILQLSVLGDTLGNMQIQVNNKETDVLDAKIALKGYGNNMTLSGASYLKPKNENDFDFKLAIDALSIRSFESIAQHQVKNSSGFLRGNLDITGTIAAPKITGALKTDNIITTVTQLNAAFKMPAENLTFTNDGIVLNNFKIKDSANNQAVIDGTIDTRDLNNINMGLHLKARNWQALHSTAKDNKLFYGDVMLTANMDIKGSVMSPSVDGDLRILKGTNFTVVTPETKAEMQDTRGIVEFVNMKDTGRHRILVPQAKKTVKQKISAGADFNLNITVDKEAQFSLIIDQTSGDFLHAKGEATINAAYTPGGNISLTGNYALHEGLYQLNYNFIKRKFVIKDGSSITFGGDPIKETRMDVTAAYEAQVPPYDLVQRQVTDAAQLNYYKQRLPFNVDLHIKGAVMQPQLTFDITLPENKVYPLSTEQIQLVQGKLSQIRTDTSELNKQVFALLILSRFVSDDPFNSGAGTSAGFTALQSVSTFIGEQLNQAANTLIKGVDFSVDLGTTQDYTTGDMRRRTDLNLAASKRLLNDRLKLTIGNNFELEGPQTSNTQNAMIPTNLAADYQLTADGKYTIRAYRKAYDEGVLQGYVTETGLNFIVSLDYNNFKKAFMNRKHHKDTSSVKH